MKAGVLGSGLMGSVIAWDLARSPLVDEVVVADLDKERLDALRRRAGKKLSTEVVDVKDEKQLAKFLKGFDVVSAALPHGVVHTADVVAANSGTKMVDIAFEDEQMRLDAAARRSGALLIPGCGLAPGLGGILLAEASRALGGATEGHIWVGGLPQRPLPPLGYRLVFSIVGLLREYTDEARIVREGEVVKVMPFDEILSVDFPKPVGRCEAFFTDGLATLLYTMKGFETLDEITVRWPGHATLMKFLRDSGFLSKDAISAAGKQVAPYDVSAALLSKLLATGDPKDVTVMRVEAKKGRRHVTYEMVDMYDEENRITSMGKTTGYTCSIVSQMVGAGSLKGKGVVPPEAALGGAGTRKLLAELSKRGVSLSRSSNA